MLRLYISVCLGVGVQPKGKVVGLDANFMCKLI